MRNERRRSPWNSLEIAKLFASLITPVLVLILGYQINKSFREADDARQDLEKTRIESQTRQSAVLNLSRFIYERRVRAELLASGLRRHSESPTAESKREILERKRQYDDAYFTWNASHQANLLLVRQVLGSDRYSQFESMVEFRLVKQTFTPLDKCLTRAFDATIRGQDARPLLNECNASNLTQRALDCGYALTDVLFRLSSPSGNKEEALAIVNQRCPE
jgi:hypothetical protein